LLSQAAASMRAVAVILLAAATVLPEHQPVSSLMSGMDMNCWQNMCGHVAQHCAETDPVCKRRLTCEPGSPSTMKDMVEHCYAGLSFADLQQSERKLFGCAGAQGCVPKGHPALSFLEEAEPGPNDVDMSQFLLALEKAEGERLRKTEVEALSEAGAKQKIAKAAEQLEVLHKRALPQQSSLQELDRLDESLAQVQAELDAHELRSRTALSAPPLGMVLSALKKEQKLRNEATNPGEQPEAPDASKEAAADKEATAAADDAKDAVHGLEKAAETPPPAAPTVEAKTPEAPKAEEKKAEAPKAEEKKAEEKKAEAVAKAEPEKKQEAPKPAAAASLLEVGGEPSPGTEEDLEKTPMLGARESLADFIKGLGGDTPALMKLAEKQRAEDAKPLQGELSQAFQQRYMEESARLGRPTTRADAAAAEQAASTSSLVQSGRSESPGAAAIEDTMRKLAAFTKKVTTDFHKVGTDFDKHNLRNEDA